MVKGLIALNVTVPSCPQLPAAHFFLLSHLSHVHGIMEQLIIRILSVCVSESVRFTADNYPTEPALRSVTRAAVGVIVHDLKFSI